MPNTSPAIDEASVLGPRPRGGGPLRLADRRRGLRRGQRRSAPARRWPRSASWPTAARSGSATTAHPVRSPAILRSALVYAGMLGRPVVDHPEDPTLTAGAEANEGLVATILGLKGWPAAAEASAVARDLAILADALADEPRARLHLTHLSTAASLDLVRRAKAAGLPVTCDVTPHHLALTDEWVAGARRFAWEALDADGRPRSPWADGALVAAPVRPRRSGSTRRSARPTTPRRSWRPRRRDGRRDRDGSCPAHPGRQGGRVRAGRERDLGDRDRARARPRGRRRRPPPARAGDRAADDRSGRRPRRLGLDRLARARRGRAGRPRRDRPVGDRGGSSPRRSPRAARTRRSSGATCRAACS